MRVVCMFKVPLSLNIRVLCFVVLACFPFSSIANDQGAELRKKVKDSFPISKDGVCVNDTATINIRDVIRIANRELEDRQAGRIIGLNGESVFWYESGTLTAKPEGKTIFDLDGAIAERFDEEDIDVDLEFILLQGKFAVLWRETFKHKRFRIGIYTFKENTIQYFCSGMGGIGRSH